MDRLFPFYITPGVTGRRAATGALFTVVGNASCLAFYTFVIRMILS